MDAGSLLAGRTRETRIRRDAAGRWYDGDDRITHAGVTAALDGYIDLAEDGRFALRNEINWAYAAIEGPPYFVRSVTLENEAVTLHLSGGRTEPLDPSTLAQDEDGALYGRVTGPPGGCREHALLARFDNHAAAALAPLLDEDEIGVYVRLAGRRVRPPLLRRAGGASSPGDSE